MTKFIDEALRELDTKQAAHFTDEDVERLFRISRRVSKHVLEMRRKITLTSPNLTGAFLQELLKTEVQEHFGMIFVDAKNQVLGHEILVTGTIDKGYIYPREVVSSVLKNNAVAVIFFHNHPSGDTEASQADRQLTRKLKLVLDQIDVQVLDHIIVGLGETSSFADRGWI